uniref:SUN domain-containing protein n=1 Tax=Globodera rostochiensis TaxID=31243 RepID=A0A914H6H9_GLORO
MSAVFDSFRRRMSFSPSPSSSRTPTPVKRAGSTTSRLSKEEIDEILDSPYETKYTYSDSAAYKPHIGSRDYVHPRLCRRLTSQSTSPLAPGTSGTLPPNGAGWQWHNWQREKWTWAQLLIYIAQFLTIFTYTAVQYSLNRVYYATRYIFTSAVWYVMKYFVLWPILAPYYAALSYYNKARFVWRTTHNVWSLISWTFGWLTGQTQQQRYGVPQPDAGVGFGVRTRGMARREQEILPPVGTESTITKYPHSVKSLFYPLLLLLLLFAGYTLYGDRRIRMAHEPVEKTQPSDELHQAHLANPSTPKTAIVMDQPQLHLRLPKPALPKAADEAVHQLENTTHNAFASFVEGISLAGQSLLELIVDTFVGTYELLKRIFFVIVSMPIKFAKTLAHFARTVVLSIWASLRWMVERLAELPYTLTSSLKQAVQLGIKNISTGTKAFGHDVSIKVTEWKAWLSNAIYEHFVSIWRALRWVVFQFGHTVFVAFDVIGYAAQKTLDGCIYAKNTTVATLDWLIAKVGGSIFYARDNVVHFFWSIGGKIVRAFIFVRDTVANFFLTTFGKVIDGCISAKHMIVSSLDWLMTKVSSTIFFVRDTVVHFFRSTFEKIFTVISVLFGSIAHFFTSIYNAMASFLQNIWNYMQPSKIATKVEDTLKEAKEEVVPLYDDHPLVQHFNRILTVTLAEEHRSIEKRLREWAELQATTPSPSPVSNDGKELEDNLRNELDLKMRNEKEELSKTVNKFEEQILQKIRLIIEQMRSQKDTLEQEIDEMRKTQLELKNNAEQSASPLLKKEKITQQEKDGRTETIKESTVLLAHKKQLEQYDERSLLVKVRNLVKEELRRYDADRTGLPDYALESSGGSVLSTRCTVKYDERSRVQKLFGIPLWHLTYSPRSVIQRTGNGVSAGECWAYYGGHGYLTIGLSKRINVTAVSYEHLPVELSPEGHIRSAPRNFFVWSYQDIDNLDTRFLLGNFTYDAEGGDPLQMFPIQHWDPRGTQIVELETLSNWGAHVTCLYRFRVHGESGKKIPEVSAAGLSSFDPKLKSSSVGAHKGHGG